MPDRLQAAQERARRARERLALEGFRSAITDPDEAELADAAPATPAPSTSTSGGWTRYIPAAVRGLSGLVSGLAADIPLFGTAAGGAVGAGGEGAAEYAERKLGMRKDYSPAAIATEGALGMVPFAGLRKLFGGGRVVADVLAGGAMAGGGALARQQTESDAGLHLPTSDDLRAAGRDALVGGGTAGAFGWLFGGRAPSKPRDVVERFTPNISGVESGVPRSVDRIPYGPPTEYVPVDRYMPNVPASSHAVDETAAATRFEPLVDRYMPNVSSSEPIAEAATTARVPYGRPEDASPGLGRLRARTEPALHGDPALDDVLTQALDDIRTPNSVELPLSHPSGGAARWSPMSPADEALTRLRNQDVVSQALEAERNAAVEGAGERPRNFGIPETPPVTDTRLDELVQKFGGTNGATTQAPSAFRLLDPRRALPAFGETSETAPSGFTRGDQSAIPGRKTLLRPEDRTIDLANEKVQEIAGPNVRVTRMHSYLRPKGDDEVSRALRQRAHIDDSMRTVRQRLNSESGEVDPQLLQDLAIHGGSALVGSAIGAATDDEDPTRGAILGGVGGLGISAGVRNPKAAEGLRFFSMLSSPLTHAKNILGNAGSLASESAVKALSGDAEGAGRLLLSPFRNLRGAIAAGREAFSRGTPGEAMRTGEASGSNGLLSIPGRSIAAVDAASRHVLEAGGIDPARAAKATFSNEPESRTAQWLLSGQRGNQLVRQAVPFAKTPLNIVERGVEHSPFAWFLPSARAALQEGGPARREALARMALGTAAGVGAYEAGVDDPTLVAAAGPLALPVAFGGSIGGASEDTAGDSALERGLRRTGRLVPGLTPTIPGTQEYLASFVPNIARDAAELLDGSEREAPGYFGESARRVPLVRESLPVKHGGSGSTSRRRKRRPGASR